MASKKAVEIRDRIMNLAHDEASGWEPVPGIGLTIRFSTEHETPDWARQTRSVDRGAYWGQPTYHSHVFVTLVASKVILGVASAPWVGRTDSEIPYWLAEAILADHTLAGDHERINALRAARKARRP